MTGHGAKFGRKKEEAIAALLSQPSIEQAGRVAGIGPKTLLRWLKLPEFQAAYREARRDGFGQATARLQQASGAAASVLLKMMVDQNSPASTRVRAAQAVLDRAAKAIELEDLEVRVAELERSMAAKPQGYEMQKQLLFRINALEQRLPDEAGATKTVSPEWLIEELRKQGFRFDASGRPDMTSVSAGHVDNAI